MAGQRHRDVPDGLPLAIATGRTWLVLEIQASDPIQTARTRQLDGPISSRLDRYFDTSVFSQTGNFTFGNVSRFVGNLRAPGLVNIDFSLFKTFHPVERMRVQFRAEAYNLANHPTWAAPVYDNRSGELWTNHERTHDRSANRTCSWRSSFTFEKAISCQLSAISYQQKTGFADS